MRPWESMGRHEFRFVFFTVTVVTIDGELVSFDAINATLERTNLGDRLAGDVVNVERSARQGDENGGHAMYGHVSDTARIHSIVRAASSRFIPAVGSSSSSTRAPPASATPRSSLRWAPYSRVPAG